LGLTGKVGLVAKLVWRVKLVAELRPGDVTETEVARIERDEQSGVGDLGLRLAETKQLMAALQAEIVPAQVAAVGEQRHCCSSCGRRLASKGHYPVTFRSLFGDVLVRARRLLVCPCQERPSRTWGWSGRSPKRTAGPALRDGIIPVERTVHDGSPNFQHQMGAPRRPAHLLLGIHSPIQQPLHRALGDRRRNWFFAAAGCRVVDDDVGLSRHVSLEIAQKARHLAGGGSRRRHIVHCNDGFGNEIRSAFDLTMPQTPSDPLDSLGEASTSLAISLRGVGPARGRLCDVLNPHREMKPVQYMMSRCI
jgi:hypothetical protein